MHVSTRERLETRVGDTHQRRLVTRSYFRKAAYCYVSRGVVRRCEHKLPIRRLVSGLFRDRA
jgi:hypothetical protein